MSLQKVFMSIKKANIYKELMVVLHSFIEFERLYLEVTKPLKKEKAKNK